MKNIIREENKGGKMLNIAIDGHVSSGKSTLAHGLAKKLGIRVLDTGAIYRGLACAYDSEIGGEIDEKIVDKFIENVVVKIEFIDDVQHVFVNGKDYTPFLRLEKTSVGASKISQYPKLREKVLSLQRDFANNYDCVVEGRDIGSHVLPNAQFKFFVTANAEKRAMRRYIQIKDVPGSPTYDEILKDLLDRDYRDEHRAVAPLIKTDDAILVDNTDISLEQTIDKCAEIVRNGKK